MKLRERRMAAVIVAVEEMCSTRLARRDHWGELIGVTPEDVLAWIFDHHAGDWEELFKRASPSEIAQAALLEAYRSELLNRTRDRSGLYYRPVRVKP